MISYSGVPLYAADAAPETLNILAYLERFASTAQVAEFEPHPWADPLLPGLALRPARAFPPIVVNQMRWPRDACRFATAYCLCTGAALEEILPVAYACGGSGASAGIGSGSGSGSSAGAICPLPLVFDDGAGRPVTAMMYLLPPRPLVQTPRLTGLEVISASGSGSASASASAFTNEIYLLTFVDERYFWWYEYGPVGGASWAALFTRLAGNLRAASFTSSSILGSYLTPGPSFLGDYASTPQSLDAACFQTNLRLVRTLDGAISVQDYATALAVENANLQHSPVPTERATGWRKVLGGTFRFLFDRFLPSDLAGLIPQSVTCVFPRYNAGVPAAGNYQTTIRLTDTGLTGAGQPYHGVRGFAGSKPTILDQPAQYPSALSSTPDNQSNLNAYALQWTTDWYRWQLSRLDWTMSGLIPWVPCGLTDEVIWTHHANTLTTRVLRGPLNDVAVPVALPPPCCGSGSASGAGQTITVVTGICVASSGSGSGTGSGSAGSTVYWCVAETFSGPRGCVAALNTDPPPAGAIDGPFTTLGACELACVSSGVGG